MRVADDAVQGSNWRWLDPALESERWSAWETAALLLWFAVAGFAVWQHVPWADEEQAWLLAAGVGWKALFVHNLHYEGEGGLWHTLLKLLQALGASFNVMRWFAMAAEGAAMALLLRWAPFPRAVRLLLPFTFFLLYQDAVVARPYCLFALLGFPAAAMLRQSRPRPLALALLLGCLALFSVHGMVLAAGLAVVAPFRWKGMARGRVALGAGMLLAFFVLAAYETAPARDIDFSAGNNLQRSFTRVERQLGLHPPPPPPSIVTLPMAGLPPAPEPVHHRGGLRSARYRGARILGVITYPLSSSRLLALLLAAAVVTQAFLHRRSRVGTGAIGLAPWVLMVAVFSSLYLEPRHAGTVLTAFLVSAWLTWPPRGQTATAAVAVTRVAAGLLLCAALVQTGWSAHAILSERKLPYAPGRMTAAFLRSRGVTMTGSDRPLAGYYYYSMSPLLHFNRNLYFNQPPHRYWLWSTSLRTYSTVQAVLARHPRMIVIGGIAPGPDVAVTRDWEPNTPPVPGVILGDSFRVTQFFEAHGYRITHLFCGHRWMRATYAERQCDTILEPQPGE